ncbi:hypothetical protein FKM82_020447, partial [Ascaphus truei]
MKQRVRLVVLENDELHNHLKSKIMQNVMKEQTLLEASTASENSGMISGTESRMKQQVSPVHNISHQAQLSSSNTLEQQKWQLEL